VSASGVPARSAKPKVAVRQSKPEVAANRPSGVTG
jgi:hypothetical protein